MRELNKTVIFITVFSIFVFVGFTIVSASTERVEEIIKNTSGIEVADHLAAAVNAQQALKSEDPLERSIALEKSLQSKHSRVRAIGFRHLVEIQKRLVVNVTTTEDALRGIKNAGDKDLLLGSLTLKIDFEDFDNNTSRFKVDCEPWGRGEGMIGVDGITITIGNNKLNINSAASEYLIGTASYRLSNTPIPIELPAKAALP